LTRKFCPRGESTRKFWNLKFDFWNLDARFTAVIGFGALGNPQSNLHNRRRGYPESRPGQSPSQELATDEHSAAEPQPMSVHAKAQRRKE